MYPLGVLFGLGFDTSSEIALLGISAISASQGTSIWLILLFPVLFTSGMCLLDTIDGALMMSLYTSTRLASDNIAVLYYQSILTGVTVLVAVVIGVLQFLGMLQGAAELEGGFWDGVQVASDHYDIIGKQLNEYGYTIILTQARRCCVRLFCDLRFVRCGTVQTLEKAG